MKNLVFGTALILVVGVFSGCSSAKSRTSAESLAPKDQPKIEILLKQNQLSQGLRSLKGKKATALFIYNLPDSYLIKSRTLFNPPDSVMQDVLALQTDRQEWFDEMIVTYCDDCKNINVEIPLKAIPEKILLNLIDKASLNQDVLKSDFDELKPFFKDTDIFWVILGSENYEQRRGETAEATMVSALAENSVTLRSFIFDIKKNILLNKTQVRATDKDYIVYERVMEATGQQNHKPKILFEKMKDKSWPFPVGRSYDSPKYDDTYPYPPVPESGYIVKKALSAVGESLNP